MIFEALFIALPFLLGLGVSSERRGRGFVAWMLLEVFLLWLALTAFRQPFVTATGATLAFGTVGFGIGRILGALLPKVRPAFAPGLAFIGGAVVVGAFSGSISAPLRKETLKLAKLVEVNQDAAWRAMTLDAAGRVTVSEPSHLLAEVSPEELRGEPFSLVRAEYWLTPRGEKTLIVVATEYQSRLVPSWLWGFFERRSILAEHHAELAALPGELVPIQDEGVHVLLTVQTNPPTRVTIIPPVSSNRPLVVLGQTPLVRRGGAQVGDTVLLENDQHGVHYEEMIEFGEPGESKLISKVFTR